MNLMKYQNMFQLTDNFTVYPSTLKEKFDIEQEKFEVVAGYLKNYNWITIEKTETNSYIVSINYENIDKRREWVIKDAKNKKKHMEVQPKSNDKGL